eukprot:Gb_38811 [translate_table: standard]
MAARAFSVTKAIKDHLDHCAQEWKLFPVVYAWELPGVAGNACNGLTPTVALQLATVVYGANLFSVLLEDLEAAWLLECLRTLVEGLAFEEREVLCQTLSMADLKRIAMANGEGSVEQMQREWIDPEVNLKRSLEDQSAYMQRTNRCKTSSGDGGGTVAEFQNSKVSVLE